MTNLISVKIMQERAAALMETASENCRDNFTYPPKTKEQRDYQAGAIIHGNAAVAIRALPAPTEAEVLAAAMELPQIKALKLIRDELDNLLDAITADDKFGDRSLTITGPTSNLKWLIEAQDDARSAIAAYAALAEGTPT